MSGVFVHGIGAVSPAGWGVAPMQSAMESGAQIPIRDIARPGRERPLRIRTVPPPRERLPFTSHARLRRSSPITQYAAAAALEALGGDIEAVRVGALKLGIVLCVMSGCVNYTRRFYDETLRDPATASPLIFPETVFNAPASHIAALLNSTAINYTLVGDPGTFLQGLALAATWLRERRVDGCLVLGAEEHDWLTADAFRLFSRSMILSDGAGALYLRGQSCADQNVELAAVTDSHIFTQARPRALAVTSMREQLRSARETGLLCDGSQNVPAIDKDERQAWADWTGERISPKTILGDGLMAAAGWQCVLAAGALRSGRHETATVSIAGCNQQAIGAVFARSNEQPS